MKRLDSIIPAILLAVAAVLFTSCAGQEKTSGKIVVAYVTGWNDVMPDPFTMTHINFAFGHVNETFDGISLSNHEGTATIPSEKLKKIVALKELNPALKVQLSIGGWGSGRFSEMASTEQTRAAFAADCRRIMDEFGLDGIDMDWEYPTSSSAGISSSPDDTENFTLLMKAIRDAIGRDALLTMASVCSAKYVDFPSVLPYLDFVNVMSYDMRGRLDALHSALHSSPISGYMTTEEAMNAHTAAGIPKEKLTVGLAFYGRGVAPCGDYVDYKDIPSRIEAGFTENWDEQAMVPYLTDGEGRFALGYENARSLSIKCQYILDGGFLGAMYWEYSADSPSGELRDVVAGAVL